MVLEVSGVTHYYGDDLILDNISFTAGERDRIGVVGYNGCGKTTLLNIIAGELTPVSGTVRTRDGATVGYQRQAAALNPGNTVLSEMKTVHDADGMLGRMKELENSMGEGGEEFIREYETLSAKYEAIGGYDLGYMIRKVLNGMSFGEESWEKSVGVLSGGERTRLAFAKLLISHPDILILDEPTNHLDSVTLEWLEEFLSDYSGAVLTVSHDRWFLDKVTTEIIEIINHKARIYRGNYSAFSVQRDFAEAQERKDYERNREKAEKLKEYAERNIARASTSNMAKSRLKMLGRMDLPGPENMRHEEIRFSISPASEPYSEVLTVKNLTVKVKGRALVDNLDCLMLRGERLAVVGPNGGGKTTLLNVIDGKRKPERGSVRFGGGVKRSFLAQNLFLRGAESPIQYIWNRFPSMTQLQIRNLLASVGFRGEEVFTEGAGLSGGELARLNLALISLERPNVLILDEPTNHLDIYSKEILTEALESYAGTMIVVTHDRYLLSRLGAKILYLDGLGNTVFFESFGDYRDYLDGRKNEKTRWKEKDPPAERKGQENQKETRREKARLRERVAELESGIEKTEKTINALEAEIQKPEVISDHVRLTEISEELEILRERFAMYADEWLRLT